MIDRLEAEMGIQPQALLADGALGTGANLSALEQRGITAFIPVESQKVSSGNPALRPDPTQPVPAEQWDKLPRRDQTQKRKNGPAAARLSAAAPSAGLMAR